MLASCSFSLMVLLLGAMSNVLALDRAGRDELNLLSSSMMSSSLRVGTVGVDVKRCCATARDKRRTLKHAHFAADNVLISSYLGAYMYCANEVDCESEIEIIVR